MTALIRKDIYVLYKQFWLFAVIIMAFQALPGTNYLTVLYAALLPSSAFAYDDRCKWGDLAAMMPYSTWDLVLSRYILGWLGIVGFTATGLLARTALSWLVPWPDEDPVFFAQFAFGLCLLAISMPVLFRFDAERSRVIRMVMIFVICAFAGGMYAAVGVPGVLPAGPLRTGLGGIPFLLVSLILTGISLPLSHWACQVRRG